MSVMKNMAFCNFLLMIACFGVCFGVSFAARGITLLPVSQVPKDQKPGHGECFLNKNILCDEPRSHVQYDGENCVDCICSQDGQGVSCCFKEPFPLVKKPRHCERYLNTTSCEYEFTERCRNACVITGYEYSELPGF